MTLSPSSADTDLLRFAILDEDDLAVMAAHLQDAELHLSDTAYLAASRCFALVVCRVAWDSVAAGNPARRETGFHFAHVERVQRTGFDQDDPNLTLQLLTVTFGVTDAPAGEVLLTFAGGRMIKLAVECLEAEMRDLGPCWPVEKCPTHDLDDMRVAG